MKRTLKILICLVFAAVIICAFFGCSGKSEKITGDTDENADVIASEQKTTEEEKERTTVDELGKSISFVLTEEDAEERAYTALKQKCDQGTYSDIKNFSFSWVELKRSDEGCAAFNNGYGNTSETENFSSHAYYTVGYTDTSELAGHAYICIDAVNGDVLFSGYSGD